MIQTIDLAAATQGSVTLGVNMQGMAVFVAA